jgi:hypothetical protein
MAGAVVGLCAAGLYAAAARQRPHSQKDDTAVAKATAEVNRLETLRIANLPKDAATKRLLAQAERYFKEPGFVWGECGRTATSLTKKGHPTSAVEIVQGAVLVMQALGVQPRGDISIQYFVQTYDDRRVNPSWRDGRLQRSATHNEALALLVDERKFGNEVHPIEEHNREFQSLVVGKRVTLIGFGDGLVDMIDSSDLATRLTVPSGTPATVSEIKVSDAGHRTVHVRLDNGRFAGHQAIASVLNIKPTL